MQMSWTTSKAKEKEGKCKNTLLILFPLKFRFLNVLFPKFRIKPPRFYSRLFIYFLGGYLIYVSSNTKREPEN